MHYGILAVKADVAQLIEAARVAWPKHEPAQATVVAGFGALHDWTRATQRAAEAARQSRDDPGTDVFGFWQDGPWAVMMDSGFVHVADEDALAALSERFGLALSFVVETAGGCAFFDAFERGQLVRSIRSVDGDITTQGEPLAQEARLRRGHYYMEETDRLQEAFGLTPPGKLPEDQAITAGAYLDGNDYSSLRQADAAQAAAKRPWWRFW
jgi:hypothetical protein